jgi:hypothetical protein
VQGIDLITFHFTATFRATSRALLKFGGGPSDFYATARAGASTFFVGFDV